MMVYQQSAMLLSLYELLCKRLCGESMRASQERCSFISLGLQLCGIFVAWTHYEESGRAGHPSRDGFFGASKARLLQSQLVKNSDEDSSKPPVHLKPLSRAAGEMFQTDAAHAS